MSDRDRTQTALADAESAEAKPAAPTPAPARGGGRGWQVVGLALAGLLLVVGLVTTAPRWAPLLPWGAAADDETQRALAARLDRLEAAQAQAPAQRQRLQEELRQAQQQTAEARTAAQRLAQRLEGLEARPTAPGVGKLDELGQQTAELSQKVSQLIARIEAVEQGVRQQTARQGADVGLVMALLQIRSALQAGRPFAAEYEAFAALARGRSEIAEAAAPLADPAKTGVAGLAVLAKRLHELAGNIAGASGSAAPAGPDTAGWGDAALARLRGLVTIRRIDGARPTGADAAVNAAELALAGGDLAAAVAALDKLTGAPAAAAAPWLRMARQRLAVDAALRRLEALLTAGLGSPASAPGSSG
jgi:hypothetical protein